MKINPQDMELSRTLRGRVSRELSREMQPRIVAAVEASGLSRADIQAALLKTLEGTHARIGVATVDRLLKDPKMLVEKYKQGVASDEAKKQANFERDLRLMLQTTAKAHPEDTFTEITSKFPQCRNFKAMRIAARLHVENGGRPLTLAKLPKDASFAGDHPAIGRLVEGYIVLKDGEAVCVTDDGIVVGPGKAKNVQQTAEKSWGQVTRVTGTQTDVTAPVVLVTAPDVPQANLPGLD